MLQQVAQGLGDLREEVVFVGGAVTELYSDDPAASDIRPTIDVDCVVEFGTRKAYYKLEEELRKRKFANDMTPGAPICRWIYDGIIVDIMPIDSEILGFGNQWYKAGIDSKIVKGLPDGTSIFVFSVEYFLSAKLEALIDRGGIDLRLSHDFEDIIYVLDNCTELMEIISSSSDIELRKYLKDIFGVFIRNKNIEESVRCALPLYTDDERVEYIVDRMTRISETLLLV